MLPKLKQEFEWLASDVYSQSLQQTTLNLSRAFINFFEKRAKYPRFKSKHGKQSVGFPQGVKVEGNTIYLPKLGFIKAVAEGIRLLQTEGTPVSASGGSVRPTRGRKSKTRQHPAKLETTCQL